jgi:aconitate hydratase
MLLGAINAFSGEAGKGKNVLSGGVGTFAEVARQYKKAGQRWIIVGDENYGEGSSREHAAMSPRYLGVSAVIVKSFARIHETNLKKQGVLALTFANPADYDKIRETDRVSIKGLNGLAPKSSVTMEIKHDDGAVETVKLSHTYNAEQIDWFKAGSALNLFKD